MRMLKNSKGEVIGVATGDEPAGKKDRAEIPITTETVHPLTRRRAAAAEARQLGIKPGEKVQNGKA